MNIEQHGISIGIKRVGSEFYLTLKAQGTLTHEDYEIITPMIDSALASVEHPTAKVLIDGTELKGWEARAAWDDFKLGLKHRDHFEKIAIVGNKGWQELAAKLGNWFIAGDIKYFDHKDDAIAWLNNI